MGINFFPHLPTEALFQTYSIDSNMINKNFDKIKRLKSLKVSKNLKNGLKMKKRSPFDYLAIVIGLCAVLLFVSIYFYA